MPSARRWMGYSALLAALVTAAVAGAGTSYADAASTDPGYAGKPHMGLMDPAPATVRPIKPVPRPKPKPRPVVDPNIVGYAADGTPIYPWGPKPLPPKPGKDEVVPARDLDPYQTPPIIPPWKLPPALEVM